MSSDRKLTVKPAPYDGYKCWECHQSITKGSPQVWDDNREKNNQNCHEACYNKKPKILDDQQKSQSKVISELEEYCDNHMELADVIRKKVQKLAEDKGYFSDSPDRKMVLGITSHDIVMAKLTPDIVFARIAEKSPVEIDEIANSSQCLENLNMRGASSSFQISSTIKGEIELWQQQSLENFAPHFFFLFGLIRYKRFVPKCEIHGLVCNEETFACKKCVENADRQKRNQDLFSPSSLIDRSLLL